MNPEFERNLYLEFSLTRAIAMPLFLAAVFGLSFTIDNSMATRGETHYPATANCAIGLYVLIVVLWGARQAAENIFDEQRNKTWDTQKRTAISAWSLTWGKLFGSTVFNWYGGILCWFIYAFTTPNPEKLPLNSLILLAGGLAAQGLSMLSAVFALRKRRSSRSSFVSVLILFALVWTFPFLRGRTRIAGIDWFDFHVSITAFSALSLMLFAGWVIVGVYRMLAVELQIRTLPRVWIFFLVCWVVYGDGIVSGLDVEHSGILYDLFHSGLLTLALCALFSYLQLFLDDNDPMLARRIRIFVEQGQWLRVAEEIPCWLINLAIALPIVLLLSAIGGLATTRFETGPFLATAYLLLLRDTALILYFAYAPDPQRAQGLSLLWLTLLYGILPWLLARAHSEQAVILVFPLFDTDSLLSLVIAACHAGLAGLLLFQRWQNTVNRVSSDG